MLLLITKVIVHKFFSQPYFLLLPFTNLLLLNNGTIKENKKHDFDNGVLTSFYAMLKKKTYKNQRSLLKTVKHVIVGASSYNLILTCI